MASESKTDDPGGGGPPGVLPCIFATSFKSALCGIAKNLIYSLLTDAFLFAVCVKISRATLTPTYSCGSGMRELDLGRRRRAPRLPDCFSSNLVFLRIGPVKARRSPKAHATHRRCGGQRGLLARLAYRSGSVPPPAECGPRSAPARVSLSRLPLLASFSLRRYLSSLHSCLLWIIYSTFWCLSSP